MIRCLSQIDEIQFDFPDEFLDDRHAPQEVQDGLEKLQQITWSLVYDGPKILWEYAKARGLAEDIATMYEKGRCPFHRSGEPGSYVGETIWRWRQETKS